MSISNSSRVTTSWPADATSDESDYYYAELEKRMLQLMEDDDDKDNKSLTESSHLNYNMPPTSSFLTVTRPLKQGNFDHMKNIIVSLPNWLSPQPLPANGYGVESGSGTGTGVFIPLPSTRMVPSGNAKRSRRRMYKKSVASTNN